MYGDNNTDTFKKINTVLVQNAILFTKWKAALPLLTL